jgi:hypothetical protein
MGIDTGKLLHVVISRRDPQLPEDVRRVIYVGTRSSYDELDDLMRRYNVICCVIDAMPEIHAAREFARRHPGLVFLNYFVETQHGAYRWDFGEQLVHENRTEALDASRKIVRDRKVVFPRGGELMREFAEHVEADVKRLVEDPDTGEQAFKYIRTGPDHYSLAFTYDSVAATRDVWFDESQTGWF